LRYYLGRETETPSFPLEKLMGFLVQYYGGGDYNIDTPREAPPPAEWVPIAVLLLFCVFDMLRPGVRRGKSFLNFGDKRIAA
jgi:hypothetical protein